MSAQGTGRMIGHSDRIVKGLARQNKTCQQKMSQNEVNPKQVERCLKRKIVHEAS
jgi:hypothetical protein